MEIKVTLLKHTPNPEEAVALAARLCYSPATVEELEEKLTPEKTEGFIAKLADMQHFSTFEHTSFTFAAEGISRVTTHELVRHRIASYSQQSQRYITEKEMFTYTTPSAIEKDDELKERYDEFMKEAHKMYSYFLEKGVKKEDARFVLPNAKEARIIFTMNARTLLHFFNLRCCVRAQWEIREMANKMVKLVKEVAPNIFKNAGASCESLGYCPEGGYSCGKYPTLEELTEKK